MASAKNRVRNVLSDVVIVLAVALITLGLAEVLLRVIKPYPRVQVIRGGRVEMFTADKVPIWVQDRDRMNLGCPDQYPEARLVVFTGDSIFFGTGLQTAESFTSVMQTSLDQEHGRGAWCILNLSQPGYTIEQKLYWYRKLLERHQPDLVFWEFWPNELGRYRMIGDSAYNVSGTDADTNRLPSFVPGNDRFNRWLFSNSRLFEYLVLMMIRSQEMSPEWVAETYVPFLQGLESDLKQAGGRFVAVVATRLDRPFSEFDGLEKDPQTTMSTSMADSSIETIFLHKVLSNVNADYREVRMDSCCHFSKKGHEVIAGIFLNLLKESPPEP